MKFSTETGSIYELDTVGKRVRRLGGTHKATNRQGNDMGWREYHDITDIELGHRVVIVWLPGTPLLEGSPPDEPPTTITSRVTGIL